MDHHSQHPSPFDGFDWSSLAPDRPQLSESEMPPLKKYKRSRKNYGQRKVSKPSLPMAIRTRGTPDGYYEIPVRTLIKLYANTSTGLWPTTQSTGAPSGTTGYRGFGMSFNLDYVNFILGEGSAASTISVPVPGFTELQQVFDLCKIADVKVDYWWVNQSPDMSATSGNYGGFDMYVTEDCNNVDPPNALEKIMQYSKVKRIRGTENRTFTQSFKPHMRLVAGASDDETGFTGTLAMAQPSAYVQTNKPGVAHFGVRGFVDIPTGANSRIGYLNVCVTQLRRYKISR